MNIQQFVSETLKQVIDGVQEAQQHAKGKEAAVAPYHNYQNEVVFDIAVTVTEGKETGGKAGLTVWGVGAGVSGKSESSSSTVSRIKFSVAVDLPQGSDADELPDHTGDY